MNNRFVLENIKESQNNFLSVVAPIFTNHYDLEFVPVEDVNETLAKRLDTKCGIDYIAAFYENDLHQGVAVRVQKGINWKTFTVRKQLKSGAKTEFDKRKEAIQKGGIYPYWTLQAYVDRGTLEGVGVVRTKDLFEYIDSKSDGMRVTGTRKDTKGGQAVFLVCPWQDIANHGYRVWAYCKDRGCGIIKANNGRRR